MIGNIFLWTHEFERSLILKAAVAADSSKACMMPKHSSIFIQFAHFPQSHNYLAVETTRASLVAPMPTWLKFNISKRKSLNSIFCKIGHMKSLHPKGFKTAQKLASEARLIMAFLRGLAFTGTTCPLFGKCGRKDIPRQLPIPFSLPLKHPLLTLFSVAPHGWRTSISAMVTPCRP
jgi:hypothetical protein